MLPFFAYNTVVRDQSRPDDGSLDGDTFDTREFLPSANESRSGFYVWIIWDVLDLLAGGVGYVCT